MATPQQPSFDRAPACEAQELWFEGSGGIRLAADAFGDGAAPPVLMLHGGGQTRHAWSGTACHLVAAGFRVVAIDLRGHGGSEWSQSGDYSLDAFVEDLRAVVSTFDRPPAIVGASFGGSVAAVAEAESGRPFASAIVLVDVAHRNEESGASRIVGFMTSHADGFSSLEEAADAIADYLPNRSRPADLSGLTKNLRLESDGRYHWHWDPAVVLHRLRPGDNTLEYQRRADAPRHIRVPLMLVRGRRSDIVSDSIVSEFLEMAPTSEFVDVSGAGHMVVGDRNDAFAEVISEFLVRRSPGAVGGADDSAS